MGKSDLQTHAKVTTFTADGSNLNLFAHYAAQTENGTPKYHQYPIKSINLAKEESYRLRDELKEYRKTRGSQPVSLPTIADDFEVVEHQPTPPMSSKPKSGKTPSHASHSTAASLAAPLSTHDNAPSSGQKRRASPSQGYWKKDAETGRYYHQHSNGAVSWLDDDDDDDH